MSCGATLESLPEDIHRWQRPLAGISTFTGKSGGESDTSEHSDHSDPYNHGSGGKGNVGPHVGLPPNFRSDGLPG